VVVVRIDDSEERIVSIIRVFLRSVLRLLVTTNVVSSSPILGTQTMEAGTFLRKVPEDGALRNVSYSEGSQPVALIFAVEVRFRKGKALGGEKRHRIEIRTEERS
jgi:hypothetical protein